MTSSIATVPLETPIREAANLMSKNRIRHLPVFQDGKLCGVISAGDIFAWKLSEQESTLHQKRIIFLKPDNQDLIADIFPSRPVCSEE